MGRRLVLVLLSFCVRHALPLVSALAFALLVFGLSPARASVPPSTVTMWKAGSCVLASPEAAIMCYQTTVIAVSGCTPTDSSGLEVRCTTSLQDRPNCCVAFADAVGSQQVCPSGSSLNSQGSCTCASGFDDGTSCTTATVTCAQQAAAAAGTYSIQGPAVSLDICIGGCSIHGSVVGYDGQGAYIQGPYSSNGVGCSAAPTPPPAASNPQSIQDLLPGYCPGSVNGVAVAGGVPCTSTTSSTSTSTTPGPTSSASAASGASDGTSTSSSTTCSGGTCTTTTTTTTTTGAGSAGGGTTTTGSSSTTQPQNAFCQSNPSDPQCAPSAFAGQCSTGFTCKGDAVQCAVAEIEYRQACYFGAGPSTTTSSKYSALTAQDGQAAAVPNSSSIAIGSVLPGAPPAACAVLDITIPFGVGTYATSLTLPVGTYLCPRLALIRGVITAFGSLMFILIVFVRN